VALEFRLPDIGEGLAEAEIVEWLVHPGQQVALDQPLVQIETDKAVTEIPAPRGGVLLRQGAPAGSTIKVGEVLAVIGGPGEVVAERGEAMPIVGTLREAEEVGTRHVESAEGGRESRALPLVRKLARDLGVDIDSVPGTGPKGRITREDVEAAAAGGAQPAGLSQEDERDERVSLSRLRRTIAHHMARSWREIPHVTTFGEADAARLLRTRKELEDREGRPVLLEALFIKAVLPALVAHPEFNASLQGDELILKRRYDIGVAVDTAEGLIVPVMKGADRLGLLQLSDEMRRLAETTRNRTVKAEELAGATFTITNIGAVGGGYGTPIIPYGTTAILSLGRAREQPLARQGRVEIAPLMPLSLSYDHRVIDGALGRRFLAAVIQNLEEPEFALQT
jgi:pyruvate dehydrogenase E2 component (dihydrolipoyllysine-residue acetyltransferase)